MFTFENYQRKYLAQMTKVWNDVLKDGDAFPGEELFTEEEFETYVAEQSIVRCMTIKGKLAGFYVLHPNNIGRCSHVANASYCIDKSYRGRKIFSNLVEDSLIQAKAQGFTGMQYNAVVTSNLPAIHIYQKNGFTTVGTIPAGFRLKDGRYSDMYIMSLVVHETF
ncbi:GNAT family N-acetyltransferase [Tetragenococcus halophilus]|uniref:GNAT family N-acetyltransferase n=1 Tax=Tetragenococcus halophilus TaxID=51669 RepID=UPI000CAE4DE4|nr:GNAT family N-acetyltransferase [Tetragenococcus halophilus]RQD32433.1 N-acetyltransferase [Tetragenococcus halophilus subsp. halophilus DSM 20339]GBD58590.1 putative acetyltransferase [Tetragenococcus halophilus subsp. halophilus]GMA42993.1 N-acetyltransferase [Tetragenococcus halophilus subsp. halophilus DSM 20339]